MRKRLYLAVIGAGLAVVPTPALGQSSNTSSNSSSNNGVVRERIVESYCDRGWCDRQVVRRRYWDDRSQSQRWRERERARWERRRGGDDDDDD